MTLLSVGSKDIGLNYLSLTLVFQPCEYEYYFRSLPSCWERVESVGSVCYYGYVADYVLMTVFQHFFYGFIVT